MPVLEQRYTLNKLQKSRCISIIIDEGGKRISELNEELFENAATEEEKGRVVRIIITREKKKHHRSYHTALKR